MGNKTLDVASFEACLRGVVLPMGLRLDTIDLAGQGLHIEGEPFSLSTSRPGDLVVTVLAESLQFFLEKLAPGGLHGFQVTVEGGKLIVQATKTVIFEVRAVASCTLRIANGNQLYIDLESVDVMGGGALTNLVRSQLEAINPILDGKDLPVEAQLLQVEADAGRVVLRGTIKPK